MPGSGLDTQGASRNSLLEAFWTKVPGAAPLIRGGYPRIHANVPVRISGGSGGPVKLRTNDLSMGGLQIRCSRAMAERLRPAASDTPASEADTTPNAITLLLTVDGQTVRADAHAQVAHLTRLPDSDGPQEVAIGFKFLDFEKGSREALMRFIEYHMRPAGV